MEILKIIAGPVIATIVGSILSFLWYIYRDNIRRWFTTRSLASSRGKSLRDILGVESSLRRFLDAQRTKSGKEYFAVGGCIELARSPNLEMGWASNKMAFQIEEKPIILKPNFQRSYEEWKEANLRNPDKVRYSLTGMIGQNTIDNPQICFQFKKTSFGKIFAIQPLLDRTFEVETGVFQTPRQAFADTLLSPSDSPIPNFLVFHVVVKTNDGFIILIKRAEDAHFYPGQWSVSFEEQLGEIDFDSPNPFTAAVRRGLNEELGIPTNEEQVQVKLLSIFMEFEKLLTGCCAVATVPYNSVEVKYHWLEMAPDREEATRMEFIRGDIESLAKGLSSGVLNTDSMKIQEDSWHPTTKYRLTLYCGSEFGMNELHHLLIRAPTEQR